MQFGNFTDIKCDVKLNELNLITFVFVLNDIFNELLVKIDLSSVSQWKITKLERIKYVHTLLITIRYQTL